MVLTFLTVLTLGLSVLAVHPYTLVQKRSSVPSGWSHAAKHNQSAILPLRFGLTQPNIHNIEEFLLDVSDPDSPNYGNHWTPAQVADKFRPTDDTISTVRNWLVDSGIRTERVRVTRTRTWIELNATVEEAERLLRTEYHVYQHHTGMKHIACEEYYLPEHVVPHVDLVTPTIDFSAVIGKRTGQNSEPARNVGQPGVGITPKKAGLVSNVKAEIATCDQQITPNCLRALYNLVYTPVATSRNSFGIVEYTPQAYLQSDINMFATQFSPSLLGQSPKLVSIDGGVVQTSQQSFGFNGESDLDLEYGMALVTASQPVTLYQVGDIEEGL
jgi:tripeptidyl-peptidase-1